jgi:hypothetical protein
MSASLSSVAFEKRKEEMGQSASSTATHSAQDNRDNKLPPHPVHRSLRTKKKSLELPDLASLSLTPAPSHLNSPNHSPRPHYRRQKASSPIPIPAHSQAPNGADHHYQSHARPTQLPSTTQMPDVLVQHQPPTHIPVFPPSQRLRSTQSTSRSFSRPSQATHLQPINDVDPAREQEAKVAPFVPETITSTIPLGLTQADVPQPPTRARLSPIDEPSPPVDVTISWHGGGKSVLLARAGDANWKGRQVMTRRCVLYHPFRFFFPPLVCSNITLTTVHPNPTLSSPLSHSCLARTISSSSLMTIGSSPKISLPLLTMMVHLPIMFLYRSPLPPQLPFHHHPPRQIGRRTKSLSGHKAVMQASAQPLAKKVGRPLFPPS